MSDVWVDLSNEGGLSPFNSQIVHKNYDKYISPILEMYLRQFPLDKTTISVQQRSLASRLRYVINEYERIGAYPSYFDIHIYEPDDLELTGIKILLAGEKAKVPVVVGEYPIGRAGDLPKVLAAISQPSGVPQQVEFWPLMDIDRGCGVDIKPPYRLDKIHGAIK
jgi:hypothetical protein